MATLNPNPGGNTKVVLQGHTTNGRHGSDPSASGMGNNVRDLEPSAGGGDSNVAGNKRGGRQLSQNARNGAD